MHQLGEGSWTDSHRFCDTLLAKRSDGLPRRCIINRIDELDTSVENLKRSPSRCREK